MSYYDHYKRREKCCKKYDKVPKVVIWWKHKNSGKTLSLIHRRECIIALETGEIDESYSSLLNLWKKHRKSVKKLLIWSSKLILPESSFFLESALMYQRLLLIKLSYFDKFWMFWIISNIFDFQDKKACQFQLLFPFSYFHKCQVHNFSFIFLITSPDWHNCHISTSFHNQTSRMSWDYFYAKIFDSL